MRALRFVVLGVLAAPLIFGSKQSEAELRATLAKIQAQLAASVKETAALRATVAAKNNSGDPAAASKQTETELRAALALAQTQKAQAQIEAAQAQAKAVQIQADSIKAKADAQAVVAAITKHTNDLAGSIATVNANTKKHAADDAQAAAAADHNAAVAKRAVDANTTVATKAADDADRNAAIARGQAQQLFNNNSALLIVQGFGFAIVITGFFYKAVEHRWEIQETIRKEGVAEERRVSALKVSETHGAQLTQIHTLVNGSLSEAKRNELESRRANLVLLQEAVASKRAAGLPPSDETLDVITSTKARIAELTEQLAEREAQTAQAAQQLQIDLLQAASNTKPSLSDS